MRKTKIIDLKENFEELNNPVMIAGLPGVGHIGKLAADYLVDYLKAETVIEIFSPHFPPQVMVDENSIIVPMKNRICVARTDSVDIVFLVGENQSTSPQGHYELCDIYSDIAKKFGVKRIYTLGGYPIPVIAEPEVIGVATAKEVVEELKELDIEFRPSEPNGGIAGTSGLLLAFAQMKEIEGVCLMGTTSGYIVDLKCAKVVLNALGKIIGVEIPEDAMNERIEEMEKIVEHLKQEPPEDPNVQCEEDLAYFG